ncbi:MAG: TnpV protein [Clostridia bacterium]|nr:TnpV protein [Clostridia bacterium]
MKELEKYITDERTGLKYELIGDYYFLAGDDEPEEQRHIGVWGQRHGRYLRHNKKAIYAGLLISGELPDYLADADKQADELFSQLVKQMAEREGVTEALKRQNQMLWVQRMDNIRDRTTEIVNSEVIYN